MREKVLKLLLIWVLIAVFVPQQFATANESADAVSCAVEDQPAYNNNKDTALQQAIIDWVCSAGGQFNPKQKFRRADPTSPSSYFGIFASQDIAAGELLVSVPWKCVISDWDDELDGGDQYFYCGSIRKLVDEMKLGNESFYAPYTNYLRQQPRGKLPSDWSTAGKMLLDLVIHDTDNELYSLPFGVPPLPPENALVMLDLWKQQCHGGGSNDDDDDDDDDEDGNDGDDDNGDDLALEELAALEHLLRADDEHLVPLYDLYNHANGPATNARVEVEIGEQQNVYAARDIKAGDQIFISYNQSPHVDEYSNNYYSTPDFLRDYGFVESLPQRWVFHELGLGFDLLERDDVDDENNASKLKLRWLDWVDWARFDSKEPEDPNFVYEDLKFYLHRRLKRLSDVVEPLLRQVEQDAAEKSSREGEDTSSTELPLPQPEELTMVRQYFNALQTALEHAADELEWPEECTEGQMQHGLCDSAISYRDIHAVQGQRDQENHETFPTYNDDIYPEAGENDWILLDEDESAYQTIGWLVRLGEEEGHDDVCFLLDGMAQTCSNYSPFFHDINAHFSTRYLDSVRRVLIIGGGDAKILQEFLKYDTIETIVQLELDQKVVRKSFKYFAAQPHFDDERVQWWFGDAAKSLLMLPAEYFGSFDVVIVDLSESGPLSYEVSLNLTVWDTIAQLVAPEGILVKNEIYLEEFNKFFDNTMLIYFENVPFIQSWGITFGSNRKDFLHPDTATMQKWHDIKTDSGDFRASPIDLEDHFKFAHDYQKNDARTQGQCNPSHEPSSNTDNKAPLAGVLSILEAENASPSGKLVDWTALESTISAVLREDGLTPLSTISHSFEDGKALVAIIMAEGVVVARTWPKENYVAFDVQLWGAFDKMEGLRKSLAKAVGSPTQSLSSYRIITGGLQGTATEVEDRKRTGPPNVNYRDCSAPELKANVIDEDVMDMVIEESLEMIQGRGGVVAVLCGSRNQPCGSHSLLSKHKDYMEPVTVWACPSVENFDYSSGNAQQTEVMLACEETVLKQLGAAVAQHGKLAAFVVDESAPLNMAKIADRIWRNGRNRKRFLAEQFTFITTMQNPSETWRRDFLEFRRKEMKDYGHLFRAEVVLKSFNGSLEVGLLSGQDPSFFVRLTNVTSAMENRTGIETEVRKIEGGVENVFTFQELKWYTEADVDRCAGEAQFSEQRPLGEQNVIQLFAHEGEFSAEFLTKALRAALADHEDVKMDSAKVGVAGLVITSVSSEGTVVLVWDGKKRVDINIFVYESESLDSFADHFTESTRSNEAIVVAKLAHDEMPRGIGRVVNLRRDLPKTSTTRFIQRNFQLES